MFENIYFPRYYDNPSEQGTGKTACVWSFVSYWSDFVLICLIIHRDSIWLASCKRPIRRSSEWEEKNLVHSATLGRRKTLISAMLNGDIRVASYSIQSVGLIETRTIDQWFFAKAGRRPSLWFSTHFYLMPGLSNSPKLWRTIIMFDEFRVTTY